MRQTKNQTKKQKINDLKVAMRDPITLLRCVGLLSDQQTRDEMALSDTVEHNGRGFNKFDAQFLTDIQYKCACAEDMTPKQYETTFKKMQKYAGQLVRLHEEGEI